MDHGDVTVQYLPETNRTVADMLFALEVGLRELIIETLSGVGGPKWHKQLLPADVTEKYLRGRKSQLAATWSNHVEHHPLYYVDFPDLTKVLQKNWKKTFQELFGDKDVFIGSLRAIEPIRNALAHHRKISGTDADQVGGVFAQFQSAIGTERLASLVSNCTTAPSLRETMNQLCVEIDEVCKEINSLSSLRQAETWEAVKDAWWFDEEFLTATNEASKLDIAERKLEELERAKTKLTKEVEAMRERMDQQGVSTQRSILSPIVSFFAMHEEFSALPRGRGVGHQLEAWLNKRSPEILRDHAQAAIQTMKESCNE